MILLTRNGFDNHTILSMFYFYFFEKIVFMVLYELGLPDLIVTLALVVCFFMKFY